MYKGFSPAFLVPEQRVIIAEFTEHAARMILAGSDGESLRGLQVTLSREKGKRNGRVSADLRGRFPRPVPAAFDPRPYLLRLWGMTPTPYYGVPEVAPRPLAERAAPPATPAEAEQ